MCRHLALAVMPQLQGALFMNFLGVLPWIQAIQEDSRRAEGVVFHSGSLSIKGTRIDPKKQNSKDTPNLKMILFRGFTCPCLRDTCRTQRKRSNYTRSSS